MNNSSSQCKITVNGLSVTKGGNESKRHKRKPQFSRKQETTFYRSYILKTILVITCTWQSEGEDKFHPN